TVRPKLCELLPRQGVPPALPSWDAFADQLAWGERAGSVPEPRVWWWELRPHPLYGTLELRVPDAQATVADSAALVAVAHALTARLAAAHDAGEQVVAAPTWRIAENRWQALSRGPDGRHADLESGAVTPRRERLHALLAELEPFAERLGATAQLASARGLVDACGAARQRAAAGDRGARAAAAWLAGRFLEMP
ncbi:MAG: glutamate---cysteine ligase / carboxylate-amine ligase, partial [Thermoleophilaceae bacterium]|nr:glutamate---cysteine ligase / carboxylate-amine ligase [Thermoleophilaceae bacterium]